MALTMTFVNGMELLSDTGVGPAIISSQRGEDRRLLDTAWTIQIIRGCALFVVALVLAWPISNLYDQPSLKELLAVAGFGIVIRSFTPTRVQALNRKVLLGKLTAMEVACQAGAIASTIAAAWVWRSVWALLLGSMVGDVLRVVLSYLLLPGHPHRLRIDANAAAEIVRVGRWVLLSSALTFAASNLDRLALGYVLSVKELGVYTIALNLALAVTTLGRTVGSRVLYPVLAETVRESPERLHARLRRARLVWVIPTVAVLVLLAVLGDSLVHFLYPFKYHDAGWMLRILASGCVAAVLSQSSGIVWPAIGEFRTIAILMVIQVSMLTGLMLAGFWLNGIVGFVVGCASVELLMLPIQAVLLARRKLWQPEVDLPTLAVSAAIIALGAYAR